MTKKIIDLNRPLVAKCSHCGCGLWIIHCDKPTLTAITGFECAECGNFTQVYITVKEKGEKDS